MLITKKPRIAKKRGLHIDKKFHYASPEGRLGMGPEALATHWEHAIPAYRNAPHVRRPSI